MNTRTWTVEGASTRTQAIYYMVLRAGFELVTKRKSNTRPSVVTPLAGAEGKGGIKGSSPKNQMRVFLGTGSGTTRGESQTV